MGWIKTVDDYFTGRTKRLYNVGVEHIFNTVILELEKDQKKRFSFAEVGYLMRWLEGRASNSSQVELFKKLVQNGQIEFIGGGWVQPDEACTHYSDIVDQYTLGFDKLLKNFGDCGVPKIAWQIDPFGHSREHANLAVLLGHEALFHGRMHIKELAERIAKKSLEYIWNTSDDLKTNLFSSAFYSNNYAPPQNFCFDSTCLDDPVIDDPKLEGYNLPKMTEDFITVLKRLLEPQRHNHFLLSMGSDFHFTDANIPFTSLDRLIKSVNQRTNKTGINVFYSTPSCYAATLSKNPPQLPLKSDDFFPYASDDQTYWTGYFTSKPEMKRMVREASNLLHLGRSIRALANMTRVEAQEAEELLERAVGLAQHHDAITGTSKESVTQDYERRLILGADAVKKNLIKGLQALRGASSFQFDFCGHLNESRCEIVKGDSPVAVTLFNGNSHSLNTTIHIPFWNRSAVVQDEKLQQIVSDISKSFQPPAQILGAGWESAPYQLHFPVSLPPFGFKTYFVTKSKSRLARPPLKRFVLGPQSEAPTLENSLIKLNFDKNGVMQDWLDKTTNKSFKFQQAFHYYISADNDKERKSGAYIFRPNGTLPVDFDKPSRVEVIKGKIFEEIRQVIAPWVSQTIRLRKDSAFVEFEFTIGPIPKEEKNPIPKEVITRYNVSDVHSGGIYYTDANGRQLMKRTLNVSPSFHREITEPIAENYYPVVSTILINDENYQLTVLTDRSQGGASFGDGNIDLMLHRRCFKDDGWGVDEALDEPGKDGRGLVITGKHLVQMGKVSSDHRRKASEFYHQPIIALTPIQSVDQFAKNFTTMVAGLTDSLPAQVKVLTLKLVAENRFLLRIEHIYQSGESEEVVNVDLTTLFEAYKIVTVDELLLGANKQVGRLDQWASRTIKLTPMQIRTFEVTVAKKDSSSEN